MELLAWIVAALLVAVLAVAVVFVMGMRRKSPAVLRLVRGFARSVINPRVLATAGTPGAKTSVMGHVGRRTGRAYRTPVEAVRTDDGFVVALPYGTTANWVRNVLATGTATVTHDGREHRVGRAELVPLAAVASHFTAKDRRTLERFRVEWCVLLRTSADEMAANDAGA